MDLITRKATGNVRLIEVDSENRKAVEEAVRAHVEPGTLTMSDKHSSYKWMVLPGAGYVSLQVNHSAKEFSKVVNIYGLYINVSTNAIEGVFGNLKTHARERKVEKLTRKITAYS